MRTFFVVFLPVGLQDHRGLCQGHELVLVEALVPKLAVEALDVGVLDGLARPDEVQLHPAAVGPLVHGPAREFRPVVTGDDLGQAAELGDLVEQGRHALAPDGEVHEEYQAFARKDVHEREGLEPAAAHERVEDEVHGPTLIGPRRSRQGHAEIGCLPFPLLQTERQLFFAIDPLDLLVVHFESLLVPYEPNDPGLPVALMPLSDAPDELAQRSIILAPCLVAQRGPAQP